MEPCLYTRIQRWRTTKATTLFRLFILFSLTSFCSGTFWNYNNENKPALVQAHEARGRRVQLRDGTLVFVRDEGYDPSVMDQKTVVMVHGVPSSSLLYRNFFDPLVQNGYRAVAFDLPGLGLSDKPSSNSGRNYYSWPALAVTVGEILHHPDLELFPHPNSQIHLVVHDIGGPIAALYAADNIDKVHSMTILDTIFDIVSFHPPFPMYFFPPILIGDIYMKKLTPFLFRQFMFLSGGVQDKSAFSREEAQAWVWLLKSKGGADSFLEIMRSFPSTKQSKMKLTKKIQTVLGEQAQLPMHIVWAKEDVAIPKSQRKYIRDNFDVERIQTVPGGHFYHLESPEQIIEKIIRYLED